ncbi:MAG TPA: TPM domain-containing protein [Bacteroidia bacterium]|jgi:uncharacterized membrane protein|nr:TPM domain-containing protein [Bacteroidia bacterium]
MRDFFTDEQKLLIKAAIDKAEKITSGEIRLHIEEECNGDVMHRAIHVFNQLHMQKTKYRNAVLFYLAIGHKKLAVVGDEGIHAKVPDGFWEKVKEHMIVRFKEEKYTEGICEGINMAAEMLHIHFPRHANDKNQLSDEISFGK